MADPESSLGLGDPVTDPEEDAFLVFSQQFPSHALGFVDTKALTVDITVGGRDLTIHHSRSLLTSDRKQGTTGAVLWKVTPPFAEWIASPNNFLFKAGYLSHDTVALELGAGVSGVVALTLGPFIKRYIATDQNYVIRILKQNISENLPAEPKRTSKKPASSKSKRSQPPSAKETSTCIETLELDWELDSVSSLPSLLGQGQAAGDGQAGVDLVIACDTIYNDTLIEPLNNICAQICRLRSANPQQRPTLVLIAQQLRTHEIFETWLKSFHRLFHVWQLPDELLTPALRENSGFIVHLGILR